MKIIYCSDRGEEYDQQMPESILKRKEMVYTVQSVLCNYSKSVGSMNLQKLVDISLPRSKGFKKLQKRSNLCWKIFRREARRRTKGLWKVMNVTDQCNAQIRSTELKSLVPISLFQSLCVMSILPTSLVPNTYRKRVTVIWVFSLQKALHEPNSS